jgi:hypothetical protein
MKWFGAAAAAIALALALYAPAGATQSSAKARLDVYTGIVSAGDLDKIAALGIDRHEIEIERARGGKNAVRVETIITGDQADELAREGVELEPKEIDGATVAQRATRMAAEGHEVFRKYSGAGGLKEEFEEIADDNRKITKLISIGETHNGEDIVALKVSKNARQHRDGRKPSVLYLGAQHAREWITPEMIRRLAHHMVDGYSDDRDIRELLEDNELWFIPVANPDGYDHTFTEGQRMWRKNLRDNNGDGTITAGEGVDLNRNYPYKWGYDNEGSSPDPTSDTYRGPSPASEPETQALDRFVDRVEFKFLVNYHSAAELLLYGTGWQVATPTPDDVISIAMAGDDAEPAVPGYDPDISAELYTTNGDTDTHMTEEYGTLGFTPEMSTCEAASDSVPDDEWEAEDCDSGFHFPDDEGLVQAEFENNIPFALSVAQSADDPDDPASAVGREAPNFEVDSFEVSYGDPQTVAVVAKRSLDDLRMHYQIDGGRTRTTSVREWRGGERYGDENDHYYAEYRGTVRGADPGDDVQVWFSGEEDRRGRDDDVSSRRFTYTVAKDSRADVLVIASEDYTGFNPRYNPAIDNPKYDELHVAALEQAGYDADVWDIDAQGVPHDLAVLGHYDAVVWEQGENRLTQDEGDVLTETYAGRIPEISVAEREQYLTMAVRDYLNQGGKLIQAAETAQYSGLLGDGVGGIYYGLNGDPEAECVISSPPGLFEDCLILADDFRQYYLGAWIRTTTSDPDTVLGLNEPLEGYEGSLGGPIVEGGHELDEAGAFQPTSDVLPPDEFPQFRSQAAAEYGAIGSPFAPVEGTRYAGVVHADGTYTRLTKTIAVPANATSAELQFQLSYNTEPSYDNVIVEARTAGGDDWTTLPATGTQTDPPAECQAGGFLLEMHPFLERYLGGQDCTQGPWNSFTGTSGGWQAVTADLSGYAGRSVEVSISYVTDPASGGVGAFVDDTRVVINGALAEADGFEGATSTWSVTGPPEGSAPNASEWQFGEKLVNIYAGTSTEDTLLLGFGLEQMATDADRARLLQQALGGLLGDDN